MLGILRIAFGDTDTGDYPFALRNPGRSGRLMTNALKSHAERSEASRSDLKSTT
jgi:hypothetical protein